VCVLKLLPEVISFEPEKLVLLFPVRFSLQPIISRFLVFWESLYFIFIFER
jgi:hypothetical protein